MMTKTLLVVDDEIGTRESLRAVFSGAYKVVLADSAEAALASLRSERIDLMLLDITMPQRDGLSLLRDARNIYPGIPIIIVTASSGEQEVITAMRLGAHDYVLKPFDITDLRASVQRALESRMLSSRVAALEAQMAREYPIHGIIGMAPAFRAAVESASRLGPEECPVLVQGEPGAGKTLLARLIHSCGERRQEPFVEMRCADHSAPAIAGQIFGEEKDPAARGGRLQPGCLDLVGRGTLFLGEIDSAPEAVQSAVAEAIGFRQFSRRNGRAPIATQCRFVLAVRSGGPKEADRPLCPALLDKVRDHVITVPPLRERTEDIPLLAHYFLNLLRTTDPSCARDFEPEAMDLLRAYAWPGNVRELRNVVERLLVVHGASARIQSDFLPREFHAAPADPGRASGNLGFTEEVQARERELIEDALRRANGVQTKAAEMLQTTRRILRYRMERLGIAAPASKR